VSTALAFAAAVALQGAPVVVDGDTFDVGAKRYRVENVDAPELSATCPAARALARLATAELARLLRSGVVTVEVVCVQPATTRYRERLRAKVYVDAVDVVGPMIAAGVARPGGQRPAWCSNG